MVFDLIELAEREGWLVQLIEAAMEGQPSNQQLKETGNRLVEKMQPVVAPASNHQMKGRSILAGWMNSSISLSPSTKLALESLCEKYAGKAGFRAGADLSEDVEQMARERLEIKRSQTILLLYQQNPLVFAYSARTSFAVCYDGLYWGSNSRLVVSQQAQIGWYELGRHDLVEVKDGLEFGAGAYQVNLAPIIITRYRVVEFFRELHTHAQMRGRSIFRQ